MVRPVSAVTKNRCQVSQVQEQVDRNRQSDINYWIHELLSACTLFTCYAGVAEWVEQNGLKLNEAKTQMILLCRKKRSKELENVVVKLKGQDVARSRKVKYLGVWVDEGLTWADHVEAVRKKCLGGLAKLRRLRDTLPAALKKNIYNALVLPHLDYCCVLWQECRTQLQQRVERIQNYAMRLNLLKTTEDT